MSISLEFLMLGFGKNHNGYALKKGLIKQGTQDIQTRFGMISDICARNMPPYLHRFRLLT